MYIARLGISRPQLFMIIVGALLILQPLLAILHIPYLQQFDEFLLLMSLVIIFLRKLIAKEAITRTPIDWIFFSLLAIGVISSAIHHIVPISVALGGLLLFCKGFIFFYVFANIPMRAQDLNILMKTFLILGIAVAMYGILGAIAPGLFLLPLGITMKNSYFSIPALQSFLGHPGAFAAFMAVLGAFTFSQYWITGEKRFLLLNVFFVVCMILSFRRTSVAGYFLAVLIVVFAKGMPKPAVSVNRVLIIGIVFILLISFSGLLIKMYHNLYEGYFLMGETPRSLLLKTGVKIAAEHFPLGTGFGTYGGGINRSFYSPLFYKYRLFTTWGFSEGKDIFTNDTFWPHILAETGVMGFILYLAILWILIILLRRTIKSTNNLRWEAFVLGTFMMLLISVVESTKATFYEGTLWTYLYFGGTGICMNWFISYKQKLARY